MRLGRAQPFTSTHSYLRPPTKVLPVPLQREQTVTVRCVAIDTRRRQPRYMPLQGWVGSRTATTGFKISVLGVYERNLGPEPPEVVLANVPQFLQTITVRCQAVRTRRDMKRRVPPTWLEPSGTKTTGAGSQTLGCFEAAIGPMPPVLVLPLPSLQMQTVKVRCVRRPPQRGTQHTLGSPAVVFFSPAPVVTTLQVRCVRRPPPLDRPTRPRLSPPAVIGAVVVTPPTRDQLTLRIKLARRPAQRGTQRFLASPAVVGAPPYAVTDLRTVLVPRRDDWRRYVLKILWSPAVVRPPVPVVTDIQIVFAPRTKLDRLPRGSRTGHLRLAPPTVINPPIVITARLRTLMGVGK